MYKSKLQELCHQYSWSLPEYTAVKDGPDHNPRFRATVTLNGVQFQTPSDQFRSSKEAQNQAAKLAFDHFTAPISILQHSSNSSPAPAPAFSRAPISSPPPPASPVSNANSKIGPANPSILQASLQPSLETVKMNAAPIASKEISHLYKNRLQIYAQKKNLPLPTYSCETDGPPHARRFKSTVTIDEKTFGAADFYSTFKEAEQAAAKVALESLSCVETQEDETLYKSLLQELTQIEGLGAPTYETMKLGQPHMPTFVSTVGIKGETFQGQEAKTKKQAEMSAAKASYKALMDRRARRNLTLKSTATVESHANVTREHQANADKTSILIQERKYEEDKGRSRGSPGFASPGGHIKGPREVLHYKLKSTTTDESPPSVTDKLQPNSRPKVNIFSQEKQAKEDAKTNATGSSLSSDVIHGHPHENGSDFPQPSMEYFANSESEEAVSHLKAFVYPRNANSTYPEGSTILPFSDEKWVAVKVEINPKSRLIQITD